MENHVLVVMAKVPEQGKVKTRLAKGIGEEQALNVYKKLLNYTLREANCALWETAIYWSGDADSHGMNTYDFTQKKQSNGELGERMSHAFTQEFGSNHDRVVMVGADCPELTLGHIERAFGMLKLHDVVIGPANDGGYYLIAMNEVHNELFANVPWSTDHVLEITKDIIEENHLSVGYLEQLSDIDHPEDLAKHSWLTID